MGVAQLEALRARLVAAGKPSSTPIAVVENGTRAEQRVIVAKLGDLDDLAERHALQSPALLIIGEVAALAESLSWFGAEPIVDRLHAEERVTAVAA
jgi:uroporphyrin-III C-methyltransferase/precorrin-2 dehydrogenase/sirohydrochlorin ferrochelatase